MAQVTLEIQTNPPKKREKSQNGDENVKASKEQELPAELLE